MKVLCKLFGCKMKMKETQTTWSILCVRCGQGYGHGLTKIDMVHGKTYLIEIDKQQNNHIYFPKGFIFEIIISGSGGGNGGDGAVT